MVGKEPKDDGESLQNQQQRKESLLLDPRWNSTTFKIMAGRERAGQNQFLSSADSFIGERTPREVEDQGS